jgi:hypothetical protein
LADTAGNSPTADRLAGAAGAAGVLAGEREHPAAALTKTQPAAIAIRTECVDENDIRRSSAGEANYKRTI